MKSYLHLLLLIAACASMQACKTSADASGVKDDSAAVAQAEAGDGDALTPPAGTVASGAASLPACGGNPLACAEYISPDEKGCAATDGTHTFKSMGGGNNCFDGLNVRQQICGNSLDPTTFQSACFKANGMGGTSGNTNASLPATPAGATIHSVSIPACAGGPGVCAAVVLLGQMGCAATNGVQTFTTPPGTNNSCDVMTIRSKICQANLDPTTFQAACYTKQ